MGNKQAHYSSSNPQLNNNENYDSKTVSKNPFLNSETVSIAQLLPSPPSSAGAVRRTQTPLSVTNATPTTNTDSIVDSAATTTSTAAPTSSTATAPIHQHRRNMSDTSAFHSKQASNRDTNVSADTSENYNKLAASQASRVRSLNPFEDPNDSSYEDQLFGHEFDKIRKEVQMEHGKFSIHAKLD